MNERIKELIQQAGIHFHKGGSLDAGPNGIAKFVLYSDIEKFADLILEEVMQELFINGYEDAFDFLNEHFGVEE